MHRCARTGVLLSSFALYAGAASALPIVFERVADTSTAIPDGDGSFTHFGRNPSVDAGEVAFRGDGDPALPIDPPQQGLYATAGGLHRVADKTTAIPGGAGSFEGFTFKPGLEGTSVSWVGDGSASQEGVYLDTGSGAVRIADRTTRVPGGQIGEVFDSFVFAPVTSGGEGVFHAEGDGGVTGPATEGIYRGDGTSLAVVADRSTLMGSGEAFDFLSTPDADGHVVWRGTSATGFQGVYRDDGGSAFALAETGDAVPGSAETFVSFAGQPTVSDGTILFRGSDTGGITGLYRVSALGGAFTLLADQNTAMPEGGGASFDLFGNASLDAGNAVFEGRNLGAGVAGLYTHLGGSLEKLIAVGETLDGRTVAELEISHEALSGDTVAFWARFTNGTEGVYTATIPEPGSAGLLGLGLARIAARRRKRCRR